MKKRGRSHQGRLTKNLTKTDEQYTLIYVASDKSETKSLGIYPSLAEAKQKLECKLVNTGVFHIFSSDNRVIYSREGGSLDAK